MKQMYRIDLCKDVDFGTINRTFYVDSLSDISAIQSHAFKDGFIVSGFRLEHVQTVEQVLAEFKEAR